jgi:hypothetical protein
MLASNHARETLMADDLVDRLLAQTGLHIGTSRDTRNDAPAQVARIMVSALPGGSGVTFDYEGLTVLTNAERPFGHSEHAMLARTSNGLALYTAHIHASVVTELRETEPGTFESVEGASPFPLAIRIEVPAARHLTYGTFRGYVVIQATKTNRPKRTATPMTAHTAKMPKLRHARSFVSGRLMPASRRQ